MRINMAILNVTIFEIKDGDGRHLYKIHISGPVRDISTKFVVRIKDAILDHTGRALLLAKFSIAVAVVGLLNYC